MPNIIGYNGNEPVLGEGVFLAKGSHIIGAVKIGTDSSVFFNAVLRADINSITIGDRSNIQDNCTLHLSNSHGVSVGDEVTIGHNVVLHACEIKNNVTVGMSATIMDRSIISEDSIVAAGALIPPGKSFPPGVLIVGAPGRAIRKLTEEEIKANRAMALKYVDVKNSYLGRR
ncbi:MAG: gamma carbonic anhydrase family protein [Fibrobacterales bacterium]